MENGTIVSSLHDVPLKVITTMWASPNIYTFIS